MMPSLKCAPARLAVSAGLALSLSGGLQFVSAEAATAAPAAPTKASAPAGITAAKGRQAVSVAATKRGTPYRYGATGPRAFDCSGFTSWTYKRIGKSIPRTAHQQYVASIKISRSSARPGDLVFSGGKRKHHVGIYAGNGRMWHSPRTGDVVKLAKIRGGATFGRVR